MNALFKETKQKEVDGTTYKVSVALSRVEYWSADYGTDTLFIIHLVIRYNDDEDGFTNPLFQSVQHLSSTRLDSNAIRYAIQKLDITIDQLENYLELRKKENE